ncbi:MAG: PQQ-binding-like beta-propeller repeat protein [Phycisphaerae bacterium]
MKILIHRATLCIAAVSTACADWPQLGGDARHSGLATFGPQSFSRLSWVADPEKGEEFNYHASPAIADGRVYVSARGYVDNALDATLAIAFHRGTGARAWTTPLPPEFNDSWSAPCVDSANQRVLFTADQTIYALNEVSGDIAWQCELVRPIVNASPTITAGLFAGPVRRNRALITDFSTSGNGRVYSINVDPRDDTANPFEPGEIVWSRVVGATSGATVAYENGLVIVPSSDFEFVNQGAGFAAKLTAFDVEDGRQEWVAPLGPNDGFFGGVTLSAGFAYAATYDFNGTSDNSRLFKVSLADGAVTWSVPCERSASIPVIAADGTIFLSAGLTGFGSTPKLQAFADLGASAVKLWDTHDDSSGLLVLGGWTSHPVLVNDRLYTTIPSESGLFDSFVSAVIVDATAHPADKAFVVDFHDGIGGSIAIDQSGKLVSVGSAGVLAFETLVAGDTNCDGAITVSDIGPFVIALTDPATYAAQFPQCDLRSADVDDNGSVTVSDIGPFIQLLTTS